jgi:hypothetical protein
LSCGSWIATETSITVLFEVKHAHFVRSLLRGTESILRLLLVVVHGIPLNFKFSKLKCHIRLAFERSSGTFMVKIECFIVSFP